MARLTDSREGMQSMLLLQRLLSLRPGVSPFTLILDNLEQSAKSLIAEYIRRGKQSKANIIYVSFETLEPPLHITHFLKARRKNLRVLQEEIALLISAAPAANPNELIFDTLHPFLQPGHPPVTEILFPLLTPTTSLLGVYHLSLPQSNSSNPYAPSSLSLITYLATTLVYVSPLPQVLAQRHASLRSIAPPSFGLDENIAGVLVGLGANAPNVVLRIEHRRKSGRAVQDCFVMTVPPLSANKSSDQCSTMSKFVLLSSHPLYAAPEVGEKPPEGETANDLEGGTFSLTLTEKQRQDREGVVLPYTDAQRGEGGQGGRILYQMGEEDMGDWDEEEDDG